MFYNIPEPVLLHCWKHHLPFILTEIENYKNSEDFDIESFNKILLTIGNSQMDLYLGALSPQSIGKEAIEILRSENLLEKEKYEQWLKENNHYQQVTLSDQSNWTLRLGNQDNRHIHAHPSRYSAHSLRIDANTLKTIIVYMIEYERDSDSFTLEKVNTVREKYLQLSPIKSISTDKGIGAIWAQYISISC